MINVSLPWRSPYLFTDTVNLIDADERAMAIWQYSGIALTAVTITDERTVSSNYIFAFADGDLLQIRDQRTEGADDLHTVADGSSITVTLYGPTDNF